MTDLFAVDQPEVTPKQLAQARAHFEGQRGEVRLDALANGQGSADTRWHAATLARAALTAGGTRADGGLCRYCPTDVARAADGYLHCIECGWTDNPSKIPELYDEIEQYRARRTLGGPPPPSTTGWYNGASSGPAQTGWDGATDETAALPPGHTLTGTRPQQEPR